MTGTIVVVEDDRNIADLVGLCPGAGSALVAARRPAQRPRQRDCLRMACREQVFDQSRPRARPARGGRSVTTSAHVRARRGETTDGAWAVPEIGTEGSADKVARGGPGPGRWHVARSSDRLKS